MNGSPGLFRRRAAIRSLFPTLAGFLILGGLAFAQTDKAALNGNLPGLADNQSPVIIEQNASRNAAIYRIAEGDCKIEWIAWNNEPGLVRLVSTCTRSLVMQMPLLAQIVETFLNHDPHAGSLRTLFWGRIEPDYSPGLHELSFRLALAAYQSSGWDKKRGRAGNGDINGFVKDLANRAMIYPELKALFAHFHKTVYFSCAEKVLVIEAAKLPFYEQLKRHGVKAKDRLPFDCMAWFAVADMPDKGKTSTP